jgi:SAM-dependent methyltransferase
MARFARRRLRQGARVLDVGCGVGAQTYWLAMEEFDATGVDVSPTAIDRAEARRWKHGNVAVKFMSFDISDDSVVPMSIPRDMFDAAVDVCCLQHIVEPQRLSSAFNEIRRVLKPGGWLFSVLASNRHSVRAFGGMEAHGYRHEEAQAKFKHAGFNIVSINSKEHTDDFEWGKDTVAHWLIEAVKKDA